MTTQGDETVENSFRLIIPIFDLVTIEWVFGTMLGLKDLICKSIMSSRSLVEECAISIRGRMLQIE